MEEIKTEDQEFEELMEIEDALKEESMKSEKCPDTDWDQSQEWHHDFKPIASSKGDYKNTKSESLKAL